MNPRAIWHDSLEGLRKQKLLINVPFQTWQAKSLLAKSKLLPEITYNAHTYPLDTTSRRLIETEFLNYLTNNPTISLFMWSLQKPINDGGIKFPNPVIYCDLIYISNLFQYFKTREKNNTFNIETYLIEFEIGMSLSKLYDLPILNHIPHRDYPTPYYQKTLQILKEYKVSLEELTKGKLKQIYNRISYPNKRPSRQLERVKPSNVLAMIFNHIKIREKKESLQTDKTNYEIIKNIRLEVGRGLHNLFE